MTVQIYPGVHTNKVGIGIGSTESWSQKPLVIECVILDSVCVNRGVSREYDYGYQMSKQAFRRRVVVKRRLTHGQTSSRRDAACLHPTRSPRSEREHVDMDGSKVV